MALPKLLKISFRQIEFKIKIEFKQKIHSFKYCLKVTKSPSASCNKYFYQRWKTEGKTENIICMVHTTREIGIICTSIYCCFHLTKAVIVCLIRSIRSHISLVKKMKNFFFVLFCFVSFVSYPFEKKKGSLSKMTFKGPRRM